MRVVLFQNYLYCSISLFCNVKEIRGFSVNEKKSVYSFRSLDDIIKWTSLWSSLLFLWSSMSALWSSMFSLRSFMSSLWSSMLQNWLWSSKSLFCFLSFYCLTANGSTVLPKKIPLPIQIPLPKQIPVPLPKQIPLPLNVIGFLILATIQDPYPDPHSLAFLH